MKTTGLRNINFIILHYIELLHKSSIIGTYKGFRIIEDPKDYNRSGCDIKIHVNFVHFNKRQQTQNKIPNKQKIFLSATCKSLRN